MSPHRTLQRASRWGEWMQSCHCNSSSPTVSEARRSGITASIIGTAYLSKPLRQQFARQRQAATIMAAATRRMRAKGRFWTAKSNDRALLGTFQTWLSAGKLQSAAYSAISAATATTLAKSNGSSLVRAFTTWQRQSRSRWIVPAACTSYFVRRRALAAWATCCYSKARPAKPKTAQR